MSCHACHAPAPILREALGPAAVLSQQAVEMPSADELFPPDGLAGSGLSQDPLLPPLEGAEGLTTRIDALRTCDARAFPNAIAEVKFWLTTDPAAVPDEAAAIQAEIARALMARRFPARDARARAELLCPTPASVGAETEVWPTASEEAAASAAAIADTWSYIAPMVLPRHKLTQLFGPPKCGKSFLLACMAAAITRGDPFLDGPCERGSVVVLSEDTAGMRIVMRQARADLSQIWIRSIFAQPWAEARAVIEATSASAVVIDSFEKLATAAGLSGHGAHWDPAQVGPLMSDLAALATTHSVVFTHHTPRATMDRSRDSGALDAGPDLLVGLTAGSTMSEKILKVHGGRTGAARLGEQLTVRQTDGVFTVAAEGEIAAADQERVREQAIATTVLRYLSRIAPDACPAKVTIRKALGLSARRYRDLVAELERLIADGLVETATPQPNRPDHRSRNPRGYRITIFGRDSLEQSGTVTSEQSPEQSPEQSGTVAKTDRARTDCSPIGEQSKERSPGTVTTDQPTLVADPDPADSGTVAAGTVTAVDCPRCGAKVEASAAACPFCGFDPEPGE